MTMEAQSGVEDDMNSGIELGTAERPTVAGDTARLNAICPYYTMFPLSFPLSVLSNASTDERVLDPFAGRGTTLFAARLLGIESVGIDSSAVAAHLAAAKLAYCSATDVVQLATEVLENYVADEEMPHGEFWDWAYDRETLSEICTLRSYLSAPTEAESDVRIMLRALLMGILHGPKNKSTPTYLSNQMPRTYATKPGAAVRFWKARDLHPERVPVLDAIRRRAEYTLSALPRRISGSVARADSRDYLRDSEECIGSFDWVITSPPYFGMRSYIPDQWLRNWFIGSAPIVEYRENGQVGGNSENGFVDALADVWAKAADVCNSGARLVIRFGSLPSLRKDPLTIVQRSIKESTAWHVDRIDSAGVPPDSRRQASQFKASGKYVDEVDVWATKTKSRAS